jgi:hypothetical protein
MKANAAKVQPGMTVRLMARDLARRSQAAVQAKDRQAWLDPFRA